MFKYLSILGSTILLTACVAWRDPGDSERLYDLEAATEVDIIEDEALNKAVGWQLLVEQPLSSTGLNTSQIGVSQRPFELQYYKNVAWVDSAPIMVQRLLVEAFENSTKIVSVGRENIVLRADYFLRSEMRAFQVEYYDDQGNKLFLPRVNISLNVKLVQLPTRKIIASNLFEAKVDTKSENFGDIIATWNTAFKDIQDDIVRWAIHHGEKSAIENDLYKDGVFERE